MEALPVEVIPLPVPATEPANFSLLFSDASKGPTGGSWDALMASFLHDLHNVNANMDMNTLCEMVKSSGERNKLLSFTVAHGNRACLYSL